jgi:SAM-dependent methyltransferase
MTDSAEQSVAAYPPEYLEDIGEGERYTRWVLSFFRPWLRGTVCEVGAGAGAFSEHLILNEQIRRLVILEPDRRLFGVLQERLEQTQKVSVLNQTLREYSVSQSELFDVFVYINVLEHIDDDEAELRRIYSMLSTGGMALIFVPALQGLYSRYDKEIGHCRRYSKVELRNTIRRAGFEIEEIRFFDFAGMFIWFVVCTVFRLRPRSKTVGLYDRILVPFSRWLETRWVPMIGKNLLVVAVKPARGSSV